MTRNNNNLLILIQVLGLGGRGVSAGLELEVAPTAVRLEGFLVGGVFFAVAGLVVFTVLGEFLAPLGLGDLDVWGAALRLRGFSSLGFLSSLCGSFAEESGLGLFSPMVRHLSCGALCKSWN